MSTKKDLSKISSKHVKLNANVINYNKYNGFNNETTQVNETIEKSHNLYDNLINNELIIPLSEESKLNAQD